MNRFLFNFAIRPGSESAVSQLLSAYRRPPTGMDAAGERALLNRTSVFLAPGLVVRVMDVAGELAEALRHVAAQPQIRQLEEQLNEYLVEPRDLDSPAGIDTFIHRAALQPVARCATVENGHGGGYQHRLMLRFPVRPHAGAVAATVLADVAELTCRAAGPAPAHVEVYRHGDLVVSLVETDGAADDLLDQLAVAASQRAADLGAELATGADLGTPAGARALLDAASMTLLTDRRVGVPA